MFSKQTEIRIQLGHIQENLELCLYGDNLYYQNEESLNLGGMSPYQILEGHFYEYDFKLNGNNNNDYQIRKNIIFKHSNRKNVSTGTITPNIFVGSLPITIYRKIDNCSFPDLFIEVLATKLDNNNIPIEDPDYQKNYQYMLKDIACRCTELLMQIDSPVTQNFEIDHLNDNKTIYQRFAFVRSLINTVDFNDAVARIILTPTTKWEEISDQCDTRSIRRLSNQALKQITTKSNRVKLNKPIGKLLDIPLKIESNIKVSTNDTQENRFIKHALTIFLQFCIDCKASFSKFGYQKSEAEADEIIEKLENYLNQSFFKTIERPTTLKLNSPALQRKGGYRELLNAWLQFDLAAKLIWKGGEEVYRAGKRDIAVLYEYWLFFVLYDLIKNKFQLDKYGLGAYNSLIEQTRDGLNVMVKSGKLTALEGVFNTTGRRLNIKFSYNRTFYGGTKYDNKNSQGSFSGSWTKPLRPDYTLSIWPNEIDEETAEFQEKIVHIHFDSKYKVNHFFIQTELGDIANAENQNDESSEFYIDSLQLAKIEERKGIYKNADLLKMHAYKDAIRRTGGAYILYPGTESTEPFYGFHELIPGLGAFAIRPQETDNGIGELSTFIDKAILHFNNMASQHRRLSSKIFDIHRHKKPWHLAEPVPEYLIPHDTHVIVGYYKSLEHLNWIKKNMKYNGRVGNTYGAMPLTPNYIGAEFLVLHNKNYEEVLIYKINQKNSYKPTVILADDLLKLDYPNPKHPMYLLFNLEPKEEGFLNQNYQISKIKNYKKSIDGLPFTCTLSELLVTRIL
jgi:predicted component of viral defense system (DUF524 family)